MEKIQPGKYVELTYNLYEVAPDGAETLVHEMDKTDPEKLILGVTQGVIPAFEKALDGLEQGSTFELKLDSNEAFGPYDPEQVVELEKDIFTVDGKFDADVIKPGALLPMMTADGYRVTGLVKEVTDKHVKMDFNHPLAGKSVKFSGEVLLVRDATPEELHPQHGCGCGCGDDHCGCDDNCDCGERDHSGCGCGC